MINSLIGPVENTVGTFNSFYWLEIVHFFNAIYFRICFYCNISQEEIFETIIKFCISYQ